jgi:glycerophosphoryl diester phosphodiesterase
VLNGEAYRGTEGAVNETMLVIAHRGASGHAPENTLAAFKRAVMLGASFIETDLQLSRDARFVAIHDDTVNRTTNGQGKSARADAGGLASSGCRHLVRQQVRR